MQRLYPIAIRSLGLLAIFIVTANQAHAERAKVLSTYTGSEEHKATLSSALDTQGRTRVNEVTVHYTVVQVGNVSYVLSCALSHPWSTCPTLAAGTEYEFKLDKQAELTTLDGKKKIKLDVVSSKILNENRDK